jgi:hypothetical protein
MDDDADWSFRVQVSFAADVTRRAGIERWPRRLVAIHPRYEILDVIVSWPAWNTRLGVRMRDRVGADCSNEAMHYMAMRWSKVAATDRISIDTEAVSALEQRHRELAGVPDPAPHVRFSPSREHPTSRGGRALIALTNRPLTPGCGDGSGKEHDAARLSRRRRSPARPDATYAEAEPSRTSVRVTSTPSRIS